MTRRITDNTPLERTLPDENVSKKRPMRIAIVDDCAPDAKPWKTPHPAPHLDEARTHLRNMPDFHSGDDHVRGATDARFDLVFLDWRLPGRRQHPDISERLRREHQYL